MLSQNTLLLMLGVVALVFGAKRLPEIGKGVGEAIKSFKKGIADQDSIEAAPKKDEQPKSAEETKKDKPA